MEALDALVIAAQAGDGAAFDRIVGCFQAMAYASAYAMVGNVQLAEEITQEAFVEAYLNLGKLREPAAFPGWFRRIVFKQGDRSIRGKHVVTMPLETAFDMPQDELNPEVVVEGRERNEIVRRAVEALPEHERMVVVLFYSSGYALKEIAAFLEVPVTTVKKRLHDGRRRLKDELQETMRYALHEQQAVFADSFPAIVRLLIAARRGDVEGVKLLLDRKPMLVNTKAERNKQSSDAHLAGGYTALHEAAGNGHKAVVELLLDYGANVNARASYELTPLHTATSHNSKEVVALLLVHGANVNAAYSNGHTALHWAAMKGYGEIVQLLLEYGAAVNARSYFGRTPLHWAALKGYGEVVEVLLENGADRDVRDASGRIPLEWAIERGCRNLSDLLRWHGGLEKEQVNNGIKKG